MSEECKEITTFICCYGKYRFEVMQFGLMNATSTFQKIMKDVSQGFTFAMVYNDDVFIFSKNMDEHVGHSK